MFKVDWIFIESKSLVQTTVLSAQSLSACDVNQSSLVESEIQSECIAQICGSDKDLDELTKDPLSEWKKKSDWASPANFIAQKEWQTLKCDVEQQSTIYLDDQSGVFTSGFENLSTNQSDR